MPTWQQSLRQCRHDMFMCHKTCANRSSPAGESVVVAIFAKWKVWQMSKNKKAAFERKKHKYRPGVQCQSGRTHGPPCFRANGYLWSCFLSFMPSCGFSDVVMWHVTLLLMCSLSRWCHVACHVVHMLFLMCGLACHVVAMWHLMLLLMWHKFMKCRQDKGSMHKQMDQNFFWKLCHSLPLKDQVSYDEGSEFGKLFQYQGNGYKQDDTNNTCHVIPWKLGTGSFTMTTLPLNEKNMTCHDIPCPCVWGSGSSRILFFRKKWLFHFFGFQALQLLWLKWLKLCFKRFRIFCGSSKCIFLWPFQILEKIPSFVALPSSLWNPQNLSIRKVLASFLTNFSYIYIY